jgi:molecular chaperone DnaK (HSP70)
LKYSGHKVKKIVIAIPPEYGILEKTELKRSLERADLEVLRILSLPIAKAVIIALREQRDGNLNEKVGKHILIDFSAGNKVTFFLPW